MCAEKIFYNYFYFVYKPKLSSLKQCHCRNGFGAS